MAEWITRLSGYLARILSALMVFISIGLGLLKASGHAIEIPIEVWFGYLFSILAFLMTYIFSRIEKLKEGQDALTHKDFTGLEVFGSSDDLLKRIIEVTLGATRVSTINLSNEPQASSALEKYFIETHKYISQSGTPLTSFRRVAGINTLEKLKYIMDISEKLQKTGKLSVSLLFDSGSSTPQYCYHIVEKKENTYTFFFPPVDLTGVMQSFMIVNRDVGKLFLQYFDRLWTTLPNLHKGKIFDAGIAQVLENKFPTIGEKDFYKKFKENREKGRA